MDYPPGVSPFKTLLSPPENQTTSSACSRENLVLMATTLAFSLAQGLDQRALETLINLLNVTVETLTAILAQRDIDNPDDEVTPII